MGVSQIGQCLNIGQFHQRIGGRFQIEQPGFRADGRSPDGGIGQGYVSRGDAKFAQVLIEQRNGAAEYAAGRNDVVAAFEQRHAGRQNRCHARAGGDAGLATFQRRQPFLKHPHGRVGEAGIDVALAGAEAGSGFGGVGEYEAGGEKIGSACSPSWVRTWPARAARLAKPSSGVSSWAFIGYTNR